MRFFTIFRRFDSHTCIRSDTPVQSALLSAAERYFPNHKWHIFIPSIVSIIAANLQRSIVMGTLIIVLFFLFLYFFAGSDNFFRGYMLLALGLMLLLSIVMLCLK